MRSCLQPLSRSRRGFVLLGVLVFIFLLSMISLSLLFQSRGDETAGQATSGAEQAWSAAMSGVQEAMRIAAAAPPGSTDWQDDPVMFRARKVYQDGDEQWFFTVFAPAESGSLVDVRYGLSDEASRLNLNHPGDADLTKIPGLTPALVASLRQFTGQAPASTPSMDGNGLNQGVASPQPVPFDATQIASGSGIAPHGELATLDELLLAPGFSQALLHGAPPNPGDQSLSSTNTDGPQFPPEDTKPKRNRGLDQYFTVFSHDPNRSTTGQPRCNLNDTNAPLPASDLPAGFSNYVAAARAAKVRFPHCCETLEATVTATDERGVELRVNSGITKENLPIVLDLFGTDSQEAHEGLVNVNTASAIVLATLPGIDLPLAESIVSTRTGLSQERRTTVAWLYQEGVVDAAKFKAVAPNFTARSTQFRFDVIGYGLPSGRYRVLEVVIDLQKTVPRILYLRDITRLGLPINLKEENPAKPDIARAHLRGPGVHPRTYPHG